MKDSFGDRMKAYERKYAGTRLPTDGVICVRIDGKGFSKFTQHLEKPFDGRFSEAMIHTTEYLMEKTQALAGYVQSDEISLILPVDVGESMFGGKLAKINSIFASWATGAFVTHLVENQWLDTNNIPAFDCRVWTVPKLYEGANTILWRIQDCQRNAVSMAYHWTVKKKMKGLDQKDMRKGFKEKHGKTLEEVYSDTFMYGTLFVKENEHAEIPDDVWEKIPDKNKPESKYYSRRVVIRKNVEDFTKLSSYDRTCMIFGRGD